LVDGTIYAIRNNLSHLVLDFTGNLNRNLYVMGWGWHGGANQQWRYTVVGDRGRLQNQHQNRYLFPQRADGQPNDHHRLVGGDVPVDFVLQPVDGGYRILSNDLAVTLVDGQDVHGIEPRDQVLDLHADGPPVVLRPVVAGNQAQIWSFFIPAELPVIQALAHNTAYKIVIPQTGNVIDVVAPGVHVRSRVSMGGNHHQWTVTQETSGRYRLRTAANRFLGPEVNPPVDGTALIGQPPAQAAFFTVRQVEPQGYKIFFDPMTITNVSGLAVNLNADGVVTLRAVANAQTWYFV